MATFKKSPPRIKQTGHTCWAAAASSWSQVTTGVTSRSVDDLKKAGKNAGVVAKNGALKGDAGVEWLKNELSLRHKRGTLLINDMEDMLDDSHIIYLYRRKGWNHTVHAEVVWGIDDDDFDGYACMMDPQVGKWTFPRLMNFQDFKWELCLTRNF